MSLESRLADELIRRHPERAAVALELADLEDARRPLARVPVEAAASVLKRMSPAFAAAVLDGLDAERIARLVEVLPLDVAARLIRRIAPERARSALAGSSPRRARSLQALLRFPEGSAGTLMDPEVLALPESLTAEQALTRIREAPETARYNVYVVDGAQRLVGVVNLRELLLARASARLADFMVRDPHRLEARQDRSVVVAHPGWRGVHALPVVDEGGGYLGAVRYRMLRALEEELFAGKIADADASEALGRLFAAGAGGLFDALSAVRSGGREG